MMMNRIQRTEHVVNGTALGHREREGKERFDFDAMSPIKCEPSSKRLRRFDRGSSIYYSN